MLRLMSFIGESLVKLSTPNLKFVLILDDSLNVSLNRATVLSTSTTLINYVNASVFYPRLLYISIKFSIRHYPRYLLKYGRGNKYPVYLLLFTSPSVFISIMFRRICRVVRTNTIWIPFSQLSTVLE